MALEIRKIGTKEEAERKSRRNVLILSIVMISILVFSTAGGYIWGREDSGKTSAEGVQNIGDYWYINYEGKSIRLSNSPESSANVTNLAFKGIGNYAGKIVYVSSDYEGGAYEIYSALNGYAERVQEACYGDCGKNLPEKSCNDTMIVITNTNESAYGKIYEQDECVFIDGSLKAVDAFIYQLFKIN